MPMKVLNKQAGILGIMQIGTNLDNGETGEAIKNLAGMTSAGPAILGAEMMMFLGESQMADEARKADGLARYYRIKANEAANSNQSEVANEYWKAASAQETRARQITYDLINDDE